jgi:hypothetical protein
MEGKKTPEESAMESAMQFNEQYHEQRPDCKVRFDQIISKQGEHDKEFRAHREFRESTGADLATLAARLTSLAEAMERSNKLMTGILMTLISLAVGFFIWYVQSLPRV